MLEIALVNGAPKKTDDLFSIDWHEGPGALTIRDQVTKTASAYPWYGKIGKIRFFVPTTA